ncbi:MAG: oligoendopeptidase F [Anaerovoracaceae bacterium]|nr:oligoendopeptidase F [Anaerovoracaceae bacterium]
MKESKKTKTREQIDSKYKWNMAAMYADEAIWEKDCAAALKKAESFRAYRGRLAEGGDILLAAFQAKDEIWQTIERVYVYARMKRDEDNRVARYQSMCDKCNSLIAGASAAMSFFTPELLSIPEEQILKFLKETPGLDLYEFVLRQTLREKAHVLTAAEEALLARMGELLSATGDIFTMINDADIRFGSIVDEEGDQVEVTHGRYISLLESKDRRVRREAFEHMYAAYEAQKNTLATTYNYNTKTDAVGAEIRHYPSSRAAALSGGNIPEEVYDNLISVVNKRLGLLHRYVDLRQKALGVDQVHMYDLYVPVVNKPEDNIPYEKALDLMREGLAPLGKEYIDTVNQGIQSGWIDVYENEGKTSGAYSFGSYDSMPYILLNYNNQLKDVFTIVHEMGHSMHSHYTRKTQPFVYGDHSIFTAEVASTVNENLLMKHLLKKETDPERRKYLLNLYIEEFRGTLFRQTMFAEFELLTHQAVEKGETLTSEWLCATYLDLNKKYFGEKVFYDPQIAMEWARIPHFYRAFYVYQYATGYSAAAAISDLILTGGESARENYIRFLRSGSSDDPIELLKIAGVDMSKPEPIERAIDVFENLLNELETLI